MQPPAVVGRVWSEFAGITVEATELRVTGAPADAERGESHRKASGGESHADVVGDISGSCMGFVLQYQRVKNRSLGPPVLRVVQGTWGELYAVHVCAWCVGYACVYVRMRVVWIGFDFGDGLVLGQCIARENELFERICFFRRPGLLSLTSPKNTTPAVLSQERGRKI